MYDYLDEKYPDNNHYPKDPEAKKRDQELIQKISRSPGHSASAVSKNKETNLWKIGPRSSRPTWTSSTELSAKKVYLPTFPQRMSEDVNSIHIQFYVKITDC
ncbi:hypothetical protein MTP99_005923 [Tenebrio molitor]|nr:hypothetical protein MTP99_005923 [Tenebrio molitor]